MQWKQLNCQARLLNLDGNTTVKNNVNTQGETRTLEMIIGSEKQRQLKKKPKLKTQMKYLQCVFQGDRVLQMHRMQKGYLNLINQ